MDKAWSDRNLWCAWCEVAANEGSAGVDHETIAMFEKDPESRLKVLSEQLRNGTYRPQAVRRVYIPKAGGGERPLGIPTVRDRVVQAALRHVLEPIFERDFARHSLGGTKTLQTSFTRTRKPSNRNSARLSLPRLRRGSVAPER